MIETKAIITEKRELNSNEFHNIIHNFISEISEDSNDKELLDMQTVVQIIDMTYRYNSPLNSTFFSNNLMPQNLYDKYKGTIWRVHSSEKASFLVEVSNEQKFIEFDVFLDLFFPKIFEIQKKRKIKTSQSNKINNTEDEEVESIDNIDDINPLLMHSDSDLLDETEVIESLILESEDTDSTTLNLEEEQKRLEIEYNNENYSIKEPVFGPLNYLKAKINVKIKIQDFFSKENKNLRNQVKILNNLKDSTRKIEEEEYDDFYLKLSTVNDDAVLSIEVSTVDFLENFDLTTKNKNLFKISIFLKNLQRLGGKGKLAHRKSVLKRSIVCPLIKIELTSGILLQYIQSLAELIDNLKLSPGEKDKFFREQNLIKSISRQLNCVMKFRDLNSIFITPFGFYDQFRFNIEGGPVLDQKFDEIGEFKNYFLSKDNFNDEEIDFLLKENNLFSGSTYIEQIFYILKAIKEYLKTFIPKNDNPHLHLFQWENTIWRIKYLIKKLKFKKDIVDILNRKLEKDEEKEEIQKLQAGYKAKARIIKAPTGSGKTVIFYIDSLLHYFFLKERVVIIFPTRLLNLEMFQNLTTLIYYINKEKIKITAGLYIGKSSFRMATLDQKSKNFTIIPVCPECRSTISFSFNSENIPECNSCHHKLDYIFLPEQINKVLPDILVATPDKLFWDLLTGWYVAGNLGNFGAQVIKCPKCNQYTSFLNKEQNNSLVNNESSVECMYKECNEKFPLDINRIERKIIGFIILDEIHSISGLTGIFISKLIKSLKQIQKKFMGVKSSKSFDIDIETGTATIAEEQKFIEKLVEREVSSFPSEEDEYKKYFLIDINNVRYRILVLNNIFTSLRRAFTYLNLNNFKNYNIDNKYKHLLSPKYGINDLDLGCGYLYRKNDGYAVKQSIFQFSKGLGFSIAHQNALNSQNLFFISGNSRQTEVIKFLKEIDSKSISLFLANQVVSLGLNIKGLNRITLFGTPKSMNEQIQTIGRIGRSDTPGMATIILYPNLPRDEYLYENFHFYFLNCNRLFEPNPIQNYNLYISEILTPNLFLLYLNSELEKNYRLKMKSYSRKYWDHESTINRIIVRFILLILSGSGDDFTKKQRQKIFNIIRTTLMKVEQKFVVAGQYEFLNDILNRNNLIIKGIRGISSQVGIKINEINENYIKNN